MNVQDDLGKEQEGEIFTAKQNSKKSFSLGHDCANSRSAVHIPLKVSNRFGECDKNKWVCDKVYYTYVIKPGKIAFYLKIYRNMKNNSQNKE